MRRRGSDLRTIRLVLGSLAAVALIASGVLDRDRGGWALVLVGLVVIVALALRFFVYRD